jgi:hypothetical protein
MPRPAIGPPRPCSGCHGKPAAASPAATLLLTSLNPAGAVLNALPSDNTSGPVESLQAANPMIVVARANVSGRMRDIVQSSVLSERDTAHVAASRPAFVNL